MTKPLIVPFFIAHQGCPHQCIFCNQVNISGGTESIPSPAEILAKIDAFRKSAGDRTLEVAFFGGTFTSLPMSLQETLLGVLRPLVARGEIESVRISTRPDAIDSTIAAFLLNGGVRTVELGIQSMDDAVLVRAGRGHTAYDAEKACAVLSEAGFRVGVQVMPGLPGDTPAGAIATVRHLVTCHPDFFRIYPTLVIAGTGLELLYRLGQYTPLELAAAVTLCKVLLHEALKAVIPVVRIGLQANEELESEGTVIAGPYHPAFRQLVEGELFYDLLAHLGQGLPSHRPVTVWCSPGRVSETVGQRRANILRLHRERHITVTAVRTDPGISRLELRVESEHHVKMGTILDLNYTAEDTAYAV